MWWKLFFFFLLLTKIWRTWSDIWLVMKGFKFQFEGYWELFFKAFILFA
jgi:hypothetical protein